MLLLLISLTLSKSTFYFLQIFSFLLLGSFFLIINRWIWGIIILTISFFIFHIFSFSHQIPILQRVSFSIFTIILVTSALILVKKRHKKLSEIEAQRENLLEEINIKKQDCKDLEKLNQALEKRLIKFSNLRGFSEGLSSSLKLEQLCDFIVKKTIELINKGDLVLLYLLQPNGDLALRFSYSVRGEIKIKAKRGDICDLWVLKQRRPLIVHDIQRDFRFEWEAIKGERSFRSLIVSPLISRNRLQGILRVDSENPEEFTADDLRLLDIISDLAAIAIENALLYEKTEKLAIYDDLTGLYLKHYFWEKLDMEIKKALRSKGNLSLLMIDIDDFKSYNDRYGHIAGDLILKHIAKTIKDNCRLPDIAVRYGGEEFIVLSLGRKDEEVIKLAEKIRKDVESEVLTIRRKNIKVTISIGVSFFPKDSKTADELLRISDSRLYQAKSKGKNNVVYN